MISEHRAKALLKLADLYGVDPTSEHWPDAGVGELLRRPVTISRFIEVGEYILDVGSEDPDRSPFIARFELLGCDDPWEPIESEEESCDLDGRPVLCGVVDLDEWVITERSVRGWEPAPLPE
jgi:hypothetical protein